MEEPGMHDDVVLDLEGEERKVINEFCHLLEKSKQLFNGLRDMPQVNNMEQISDDYRSKIYLWNRCT